MSVEDVFGNLRVCSFCNAGGSQTVSIKVNAQDAFHGVEVENWSTVPYDVEVESELPQHPTLLDFAGGTDKWVYKGKSLAPSDQQLQLCRLQPLGGTGSERIHVIRVSWKKSGKNRWRPASGNRPMSFSVTVS